MDGLWVHYAKWNKADRERLIWYDTTHTNIHICIHTYKSGAHRHREQKESYQGLGGGEMGRCWSRVQTSSYKVNKFWVYNVQFSSVQFSRSVVSDSLRPHESQHARPPCPSSTPRVHSNSCPSSQWCHLAISSYVVPFSSCPQSLPVSESFPMSQLFAWGGQSTGVSASASFPPKKSQGWFPSEWTGWISL